MTTLPTIHLNGTGATSLSNEYKKAYQALEAAYEALLNTTCHPRDFYPQGDKAWTQARAERDEVLSKMNHIHNYLIDWHSHVSGSQSL
jgi:hypothetical protein